MPAGGLGSSSGTIFVCTTCAKSYHLCALSLPHVKQEVCVELGFSFQFQYSITLISVFVIQCYHFSLERKKKRLFDPTLTRDLTNSLFHLSFTPPSPSPHTT